MLIELRNVSVSYAKSLKVLEHLDLGIRENEFIGIAGRAGCGKTTLLNVIAGLHRPDSGDVLFEGRVIFGKQFDRRGFRRKLQTVFQFPENQFFETTASLETAFGPKLLKMDESEIDRAVCDAFASVGLDHDVIGEMSPFTLSGGQKRRLAIASALAAKPRILLLDEPFSGMDAEGKAHLTEVLRSLHREGMTILMVSHDPDTLCEICGRIIVMDEGKIVRDGIPLEIYTDRDFCRTHSIGRPQLQQTADLLGLDPLQSYNYANFIDDLEKRIRGQE